MDGWTETVNGRLTAEATMDGVPHNQDLGFLQAQEFFAGLDAAALQALASRMTPLALAAGQVLLRQGEAGHSMYLLRSGELAVQVEDKTGKVLEVDRMGPGSLVGEMQVILGGTRTATVVATQDCELSCIPGEAVDALCDGSVEVTRMLTGMVLHRLKHNLLAKVLHRLLGHEDRALLQEFSARVGWVTLPRGQALFAQGDPANAWYVVASGRLQVVQQDAQGHSTVLNELGHGDSLGEMAMLTQEARSASVFAVRDSELIRLSQEDFNAIMLRFPAVLMAITRVLVRRLQARPGHKARSHQTVAVVALGQDAPLVWVAQELARAFSTLGTSLHLNHAALRKLSVLQGTATAPEGHPTWLRFAAWLEERADSVATVLLEGDATLTPWTRQCLRQADHVILVGNAAGSPAHAEMDAELEKLGAAGAHHVKSTLVLVHPEGTRIPTGTQAWLDARRVGAHRHVRAGQGSDVDRVARLLLGRGVGLVLGGGGARGFAHMGVMQALHEAGVPVDMVGGTSMGAIMAGQFAMGLDVAGMKELNRSIARTSPFTEYTVPMVALLASHRVDQSAHLAFAKVNLEDTWTPCFAVASNLTTASMVVMDSGPLWRATRASGSLPGMIVPAVHGQHLLVDGGVINNLPGDVMRARCPGRLIAVNVSPEEDLAVPDAGIPSPWALFWNRVLPFQKPLRAPGIADIIMRSSTLGSATRTLAVSKDADLYLQPPTQAFGMLEFDALERIVDAGYRHTQERLAGFNWKAD